MNPSCNAFLQKGGQCSRPGLYPKSNYHFCKRHNDMYERDNNSIRLPLTYTSAESLIIKILDKMKTEEGKKLLDEAILKLLATRKAFNPSDNVNKFIVGTAAESLLAKVISKLGFPVENIAAVSKVVDLRVTVGKENMVEISLKNSGKIDQQPVLENYRGDTRSGIRRLPQTFIIYTEIGIKRARIVYLNHDILLSAFPGLSDAEFHKAVYKQNDSNLTFKSGLLRCLIPRLPLEYIVDATYPDKIPDVPPMTVDQLVLDYIDKYMA